MNRRPLGPSLIVEWLPPFPRPFVRLPVLCRITPQAYYRTFGIGRLRFELWPGTE